jgi:hypothetical protein
LARFRTLLFPASQLISAGCALLIWLVIAIAIPADVQETAIGSFTFGVPTSLVVTLGLSYVVPNFFRGSPPPARRGSGEWSGVVRLAMGLCIATQTSGLALVALADQSDVGLILGASLNVAALIALGVLLAQVARSGDRLGFTMLGLAATPLVGAIWLVSLWSSGGGQKTTVWACCLMAGASIVLCVPLAPYARLSAQSRGGIRPALIGALPLIPHLAAFGLLVQGLRVVAILQNADPQELLAAHSIMLTISIGLTIIASVSSYLGPRLQASDEARYADELARSIKLFVGAGIVASAAALGALALAELSGAASGVDAQTYLCSAVVVLAISGYYSLSIQFMRNLSTLPLAASSALAVVLLMSPTLVGQSGSSIPPILNYTGAVLALVTSVALYALLGLYRGRSFRFGALVPVAPVLVLLAGTFWW